MKPTRVILIVLLAIVGLSPAWADAVSPYTVDFNTQIITSAHDFRVASNWKHIVHKYTDDYGFEFYMTYSYRENEGMDNSGCLLAYKQEAGDYDSSETTYDLLVTPVVSGTVTIYAKKSSYGSSPFVEFWSVNADATARGERLQRTDLTGNDWTAVTYTLSTPQRIGIRAQYANLDNFSATSADIELERSIRIASAEPSATNGTIYWDQQPNGKVLVKYTVTVTNNGEANLTPGTEGYSISIINRKTKEVYGTTAIDQTLAIGATSEPFDVTAELDPSTWPNSYTYIHMDLRENLQGSEIQRAQSQYHAYEPVFVFRKAGANDKSSLSTEQAYGMITASTTQDYEIYNSGNAPLIVRSITLPQGFTSANAPTSQFTVAKETQQPVSITLPADNRGSYNGNLQIVYVDKNGTDQTYTLPFSGKVVGANTWGADFNNKESTIVYPEGSVAEAGINTDYTYAEGIYNYYLKSHNNKDFKDADNKFITPKLHAQAGEKLEFQVARDLQGSDYNLKVYVSTDRKSWGNPVFTATYDQLETNFADKSISFAQAGDYYVAFAIYGVKVDNIVGLQRVDVAHDVYITSFKQDSETLTGEAITPKLTLIPLTAEAAADYTVSYYVDGVSVAQAETVDLEPSARLTKDFSFSYTPDDQQTTDHTTYAEVAFADGTKYRTDEATLHVVAQPYFALINTDAYVSKWYFPTSITSTVDFGRTNRTDLTRQYRIYNWGKAPLTITSLTASQGFTATVTKDGQPFDLATQTIASKDSVSVTIGFVPTVAGTYNGKLTVVHNGLGTDSPYELALSGTMLDASLWYADFGTDNDDFPAGSLAQSGISVVTPTTGNGALQSASDQKNLFISPKMSLKSGDMLTFDACPRSSMVTGDNAGYVRVYLVSDHVAAAQAETDDDFAALSPIMATGGNVAIDYATTGERASHIVTMPRTGDYYLVFKLKDVYVDNIYGLTPAANAAHEWLPGTVGMPTEAMQNVPAQAAISLLNIGMQDETAYTVTAYVDGKATTTQGTTPLPAVNRLTAQPATILTTFRSPRVGTFPVYFEVKAGDYSMQTEPVSVTFAPEQAVSEVNVGAKSNTSTAVPFYTTWMDDSSGKSMSDVLYTPEQLSAFGIAAGTKITSISFTGMSGGTKTFDKLNAEAWVGMQQADQFVAGQPNKDAMTHVVIYNDETAVFSSGKEHTFRLNLADNPITYDGTSALRLFTNINGYGSYVSVTFDIDENYKNAYYAHGDGSFGTAVGNPVATFGVSVEPVTLSGTVTADGQPVEGATITLVSQDLDDVEYETTTDLRGRYVVSVVQSQRSYRVSAKADGYATDTRTIDMGGESQTIDFSLVNFIKGDADGNGRIDVSDVTATINHILGRTPEKFDTKAADMNDSGKIDITDVTLIINRILGK